MSSSSVAAVWSDNASPVLAFRALTLDGSVSSSHMAAMTATIAGNREAMRFGRRYGKVLKIGNASVKLGKAAAEPNVPPMNEAMRIPVLRQMGKNEKARDSFVSSDISALCHVSNVKSRSKSR